MNTTRVVQEAGTCPGADAKKSGQRVQAYMPPSTLILTLIKMPHPPVGATTLIVSLAFSALLPNCAAWQEPSVLVTVPGWALNLALGAPNRASRINGRIGGMMPKKFMASS